MANYIWLVPGFPLLGVLINGLIVTWMTPDVKRRVSGTLASLMAALAFCVALSIAVSTHFPASEPPYKDVLLGNWIELTGSQLTIPFGLRVDPLSITMMLVVTGVGTLIHIFSIGYMDKDLRFGRFFIYLNLFLFSMLTLVLANSYVLLFVGWEGVGACSYLLIGFWFERVTAAQAGKKAFLVNRVGDFGFLLGVFALFWFTGSLVFNTPDHTGALDQAGKLMDQRLFGLPAATTICILFFLGCTGKSAQLPLYVWLPDAMEGPTPVSALIHAATMVTAGVYLIARSAPLFGQSPAAQELVAIVGIATAFYAALIAFKQYDIKRVLAYSTVSQLGYMFVGVGLGAYSAGISHLVTHAFFKALMFLGAGAVMHALDGQLDMRKMGNMRKHMPVTFATFAVGWIAICGIPPFAGFFSKDAILDAALEHHQPVIYGLGVLVAAMTAFYMTRMFVTVFLGSERIELGDEGHGGDAQEHGHSNVAPHHDDHGHSHDDHGHSHDHGHGHGSHGVHVHPEQAIMNIPLIILAVASAVGGILIVPHLGEFLQRVTVDMIPHAEVAGQKAEELHESMKFNWASLVGLPAIISLVAALAGMGAAFSMGSEKFAQGWSSGAEKAFSFLQDAYEGALHGIFVKGGTALSETIFRFFDRSLIDGIVNRVAWCVDYLAESLRTLQTGYVRNYALVMLAGAVFVVACFMIILQTTPR